MKEKNIDGKNRKGKSIEGKSIEGKNIEGKNREEKYRKRIWAVTLGLATVLGLSGCGRFLTNQNQSAQMEDVVLSEDEVQRAAEVEGEETNAAADHQTYVDEEELKTIEPELIGEDTVVVTPTPSDRTTDSLVSEEIKEQLVSTPFYTVRITGDHVSEYVTESRDGTDGMGYSLSFYEKTDYEQMEGGHLFTILLFDPYSDFTFLPSYQELGVLYEEDDSYYNVVVNYPSDVQFSPDTRSLYEAMFDENSTITATLTAKSGYTYESGRCLKEKFAYDENAGNPDVDTSYYEDDGFDPDGTPYVIISNSSSDVIRDSDIYWMSPTQLRYAINEIYARHGRRFQDASLQSWFDRQSWYNGTTEPDDFDDSLISAVERTNIQVLEHRRQVNSR